MSWLTDGFKEGRIAVLFDEIKDLTFHTTINENHSVQTKIIQDSYRGKQWAIRLI